MTAEDAQTVLFFNTCSNKDTEDEIVQVLAATTIADPEKEKGHFLLLQDVCDTGSDTGSVVGSVALSMMSEESFSEASETLNYPVTDIGQRLTQITDKLSKTSNQSYDDVGISFNPCHSKPSNKQIALSLDGSERPTSTLVEYKSNETSRSLLCNDTGELAASGSECKISPDEPQKRSLPFSNPSGTSIQQFIDTSGKSEMSKFVHLSSNEILTTTKFKMSSSEWSKRSSLKSEQGKCEGPVRKITSLTTKSNPSYELTKRNVLETEDSKREGFRKPGRQQCWFCGKYEKLEKRHLRCGQCGDAAYCRVKCKDRDFERHCTHDCLLRKSTACFSINRNKYDFSEVCTAML